MDTTRTEAPMLAERAMRAQPVLLHVTFDHEGPWGAELHERLAALADDIAATPGLAWKLWIEDRSARRAGGAYLFACRGDALAYLRMHRERLAAMGAVRIDASLAEVNAPLSVRSRAGAALAGAHERSSMPTGALPMPAGALPAPHTAYTTLAEVDVADVARFVQVFGSAGLRARRSHGSLVSQAFSVPAEPSQACVLIDWTDRAHFERFVADPQVRATMRSGGALRPPSFRALSRLGVWPG